MAVSLAERKINVIAEQVYLTSGMQVPLPFDIEFDMERIDAGLRDVGTLIGEYGPTVPETIEKLDRLAARIPRWITLGAVLATLVLVWLAASQVSLLIHGVAILRG